LNGLGTLIFNKWTDKATGEEKKQFKVRLLKVMSAEDMAPFSDNRLKLGLELGSELR
jgi:hypothetical protein